MSSSAKYILYIIMVVAVSACGRKLPADAVAIDGQPKIYPDYIGATIPSNIAPLNFIVQSEGDDFMTRVRNAKGESIICSGATTDFDVKKWHSLLEQAQGESIMVDVLALRNGRWMRYPPFKLHVAEPIDPYISYRQIEPSYIGFKQMRICQRNLENFEEKEIWNNCNLSQDDHGQCINCHSYQDYNRQGNMQMHLRFNHGGTLIVCDGATRKVNLKTDSTISAGVYPAWHPTLPLIAYSNNTTTQSFHTNLENKVEVADGQSDLILYDVENNKVQIIANDSTELESFPTWSPDGEWLYYVSANIPLLKTDEEVSAFKHHGFKNVKYNIYRKQFDKDNLTFGPVDTVYMASERNASATLPRISPDGRYLLFAMGRYGTFHVWHPESDLYLMDLAANEARPLDEVNAEGADSYHSWSSTGRWIMWASRRDDGSYTRLYLAYFDKDGKAGKPFLLPQRNPRHNQELYKSYNVPEFMVEPVTLTRQQLLEIVASPARDAEFRSL